MKQFDVISIELSTAAPQDLWVMVNGWPKHCNIWAAVSKWDMLPAFVCVACGEYILNSDLPAASDE